MRAVYSLVIAICTPFVLLYFVLRGFRDRAYLRRWSERFGYVSGPVKKGGILLHAASVGEFNAASPLIKALLKTHPEVALTVSTLTPTGSARVTSELGDKVAHSYIPLDLSGAAARFLERLQPRLIVVMETEIWPNLYLQARRRQIPLIIANARLSERSVKQFQRLPGFVSDVLQSVTWAGAQSNDDAERLVKCGIDPQRVEMTGNLKFDLLAPASLEEKAAALRSKIGNDRPILVAGSTHEADESVVIPAFAALLSKLPDALLILAPRYPERFARAAQLAQAAGLRTALRSQQEVCSRETQCFVIDSIGELMTYYALGDVAFVGGSIGDQGGHNPLEPAALGKPVLLGPNMVNAQETARQLLQCDAARLVTNELDFKNTAATILSDGTLRDRMGQAARALVDQNRGAVNLTLGAIEKLL